MLFGQTRFEGVPGKMETLGPFKGIYGDYIGDIKGLYWGFVGIMENKMETTILYRGYMVVI